MKLLKIYIYISRVFFAPHNMQKVGLKTYVQNLNGVSCYDCGKGYNHFFVDLFRVFDCIEG